VRLCGYETVCAASRGVGDGELNLLHGTDELNITQRPF
jgi:hypothetical protein